jgi:antitoxin component YwqK of YwqJK toxin-antitoxin module
MLLGTFADGNLLDCEITLYHKTSGHLKYQGGFKDSIRQGPGTEFWETGEPKFENGLWENDILNGSAVKMYSNSGVLMYEGSFKDGEREGPGKEFYETGELKIEAENFVQGQANSKKC